jgi:two-component system NtrC family response regulator
LARTETINVELVRKALDIEEHSSSESDWWTMDLRSAEEAFEREYLARRISEKSGSMSALARELGISRPALYIKIKKYGLAGLGGAD